MFLQQVSESSELRFNLLGFEFFRVGNELAQLGDLFAQGNGVNRGDDIFKLRDDLLLLFVGEVFKVFRITLGHLLLTVALWIGENLFTLVPHTLQAATHGIHARSKTALEHGHGERKSTATSRVVRCCLDGLVFHVASQAVVELQFLLGNLELGGGDMPLGE